MKRLRFFLLPIALLAAGCSRGEAATINLGNTVFLGDSITQGDASGNHQSYRYELWKKFVDADISHQFVGSHTHNYNSANTASTVSSSNYPSYQGETFSNRNEGHWGWSTGYVLGTVSHTRPAGTGSGTLDNWLTGYNADTVFILLGVNDLRYQDQSPAQVIANMGTIIDKFQADNPSVRIFLGSVLPTTATWISDQGRIDALNAGYQNLAASETHVTFVDLRSGFNPAIGVDTYDGIHPNAAGEQKIATAFFQAASVPEPGAAALSLVVALACRRRHRR